MCISYLDNATLAKMAKADAQNRAARIEKFGELSRVEILIHLLRRSLTNIRGVFSR